ncbi:hypothetical protein ACFE04_015382 [Oxalis oulophora]
MAKPVSTVILLFVLFAVSHARLTFIHRENNNADIQELKSSANTNRKIADKILLPTDKPESDDNAELVDESTAESEMLESNEPEISESNEPETETTQPLTVISFRPLNRQFVSRPLVPLRHRHNCRHGRRHQRRPWVGPRFRPRDVSFVNDVILPQDEGFGFDPAVVDARPLRPRGVRFDIGPARFPSKKADSDRFVKTQHDIHDHDDNDDDDDNRGMGGFASKIRKFLGQF